MNRSPILYPVVFMTILSMILTGALATLSHVTAPRIAQQKMVKEQRAVLELLQPSLGSDTIPADVSSIPASDIQRLYTTHVSKKYSELMASDYYEALKDNAIVGYVFPISGKGLWGTITGFIGVDPSGTRLLGVTFLSHQETPGLGGRIDEPWFKEQFRNLSIPPDGSNAIIYRTGGSGNVDAITGATLTSSSVSRICNDAVSRITIVMKEGLR